MSSHATAVATAAPRTAPAVREPTPWRIPVAIVAAAVALAFVPALRLPAFYDSLLYLMLHWVVLATS